MSLRLSGGRRLQSPPGQTARPTPARVRQAVMNILAPELQGCRWLDLCSGSGSMACEALQRGAASVVAIEQDRRIAAVARRNLEAVLAGLAPQPDAQSRARVYCSDVLRWLRRESATTTLASDQSNLAPQNGRGEGARHFDLIYADPPYASGLYPALAEAVAAGHWLSPGGTLLWECGSAALPEVPSGWKELDRRRYGTTTVMLLEQDCIASCSTATQALSKHS
jgi:16S rRNA (guanine966-N2)-methyltransferase